MPVFVDTNVLVYGRDATDPRKQSVALEWMRLLWEERQGRLSMQVLHEYYVTVTRKLRPGLPPPDARADVQDLLAWRPLPLDSDLLADAWVIEDRLALAFWDALIVASAQASGCAYLLTEDLQDGLEVDGLRIVDPFGTEPGSLQ